MFKTKILNGAFVISIVLCGDVFAAASVRQFGVSSSAATTSAKPTVTPARVSSTGTTASTARAVTPMISRASSQKVSTSRIATPVSVATSSDSVRLIGKAIPAGNNTTGGTTTPKTQSSSTLVHNLSNQVKALNETTTTITEVLDTKANSDAVDEALDNLSDNFNNAISDMVTSENIDTALSTSSSKIASMDAAIAAKASGSEVNALGGRASALEATTAKIKSKFTEDSDGNLLAIKESSVPTLPMDKIENLTELKNTVTDETTGLVAQIDKVKSDMNNETTGLAATHALASTAVQSGDDFATEITIYANREDAILAKKKFVTDTIANAGIPSNETISALQADTTALKDMFDKNEYNALTNIKLDYLPAAITSNETGVIKKVADIENTIGNETTGLAATYAKADAALPANSLAAKIADYVRDNNIATTTDISNTVNGLKFKNNSGTVQYSVDNGETWSEFSDGANGKNVELQINNENKNLEWRLAGTADAWKTLYTQEELQGAPGTTCGVTATRNVETLTSGATKTTTKFYNSCTNQQIGDDVVVEDGVDGEGEACAITPVVDDLKDGQDNIIGKKISFKDCHNAATGGSAEVYNGTAGCSVTATKEPYTDGDEIGTRVMMTNSCGGSETFKIPNGANGATCGVTATRNVETLTSGATKTTTKFYNSCTNQQIGDDVVVEDGEDGETPCETSFTKTDTENGFKLASYRQCTGQEPEKLWEKEVNNGANADNPEFKNENSVVYWKLVNEDNNAWKSLGSMSVDKDAIDAAVNEALEPIGLTPENYAALNEHALRDNSYSTVLDAVYQHKGDYPQLDSNGKLPSGYMPDISYNNLTNKPTLFDGDYEKLSNKPDMSNYATQSQLFSGDYNDLSNKPTIPTKVSTLENDSNYIKAENFGEQSVADSQLSDSIRKNIALGVTARGYFDENGVLKGDNVTFPDYSDVYQSKLSNEQLDKINNAMTTLPNTVVTTDNFGNQFDTAFNAKNLDDTYQSKLSATNLLNFAYTTGTVPDNRLSQTLRDNIASGVTAKSVTDAAFIKGTDDLYHMSESALPNTGKFAAVMNNFDSSGGLDSTVLQTAANTAVSANPTIVALAGDCSDSEREGSCTLGFSDLQAAVQALINANIISQVCVADHGCTYTSNTNQTTK